MQKFEVEEVVLEKSNVIEAGAGTGKTYSIGILVLRLILEKKMPVQEILMVTFTKAAVAELETRIREFITLAYQTAMGKDAGDETIQWLVKKSIKAQGEEETRRLLKEALALMDETSIQTIHSFCQKTLQEFAFETQQVFGAEAISPEQMQEMILQAVNDEWRIHITTLSLELLEYINSKLDRAILLNMVNEVLGGKKFHIQVVPRNPLLDATHQQELLDEIESAVNASDAQWQSLLDHYNDIEKDYQSAIAANGTARRYLADYTTAETLIPYIHQKSGSGYIQTLFPEILAGLEQWKQLEETITRTKQLVTFRIYSWLLNEIIHKLAEKKERRSVLSFDDMIELLHKAVCIDKHAGLIQSLRKKYKAVFIDEFQDTDRLQYEIFSVLFTQQPDTISFLIGDPKQSIYGWRKADLFTYFKAAKEADNQFGMTVNYRSVSPLIKAFNDFFLPQPNFDTFYFSGAPDAILYQPVEAPDPNDKGQMLLNDKEVAPISICRETGGIEDRVAIRIADLLYQQDYCIQKNNQSQNIRPSDITVLVRYGYEANKVKKALSRYQIPAITLSDTGILSTDEATEILFLLTAMESHKIGKINQAVTSPIAGYSIPDLEGLDEEALVEKFRYWHSLWIAKGIYVALQSVFACFDTTTRLLQSASDDGERKLSNYIQLAEILHQTENRLKFRPTELVNWLQKATEGKREEGDEYEQRIESDAEAVQIITIHKSKGLEFNIVMAPYLELKHEFKKDKLYSFRDAAGKFFFGKSESLNDDERQLIEIQQEQENRRLLYVALTRAKYKCYLFTETADGANGTLGVFIDALVNNASVLIETTDTLPDVPVNFLYNSTATQLASFSQANSFVLKDKNWQKLSYSFLNYEPGSSKFSESSRSNTSGDDAYDQFIFHQLRKGAFSGNLVHYLMEHVDFSNPAQWTTMVSRSLQRMAPGLEATHTEGLKQMTEELSELELKAGNLSWQLKQITPVNRLTELEFNFPVQEFMTRELMSLSTSDTPFHLKDGQEWQGLMNGKIDFIGYHEGRYYIVDWKTNHLGYQTDDYGAAALQEAMSNNNYHLQYFIYLSALYKFLQQRLPGFDYEQHIGGVYYLFVRGIRRKGEQGIFYRRPSQEELLAFMRVLGQ
ncbi:MAG: UvrD-helicase domain-containing protein [Sediminibacterium sp.]